MSGVDIRPALQRDRAAIRDVVTGAFGQFAEAELVDRLVADGDVVLELVAVEEGRVVGHVLFSRLWVESNGMRFAAVALAPIAVVPERQRSGIGARLTDEAHCLLKERGETLSVVLGEPAYYGRFGYRRARAAGFESDYQGEFLQALAWGDAPSAGRLRYAAAFAGL